MAQLSVVGKSIPRIDALEKVTGSAMYCADLKLPGMLYGKILRSPHPHARIISIDISRAKALNGVKAVITGKEVPDERMGMSISDRPILAQDVVRFVGEPVVAVAAATALIAEEALELVKVDYEELPAIFDPEEALKPNPSVVVHPNLSQYPLAAFLLFMTRPLEPDMPNCFTHHKVRKGNIEAGFQEADLIIENRFSTARIQHCAMEPHMAIARFEPDGSLTLWSTEQAIWRHKLEICRVHNLPHSKVRLISLYVGGGFGGKSHIQQVTSPAILLALKTGKAVNLTLSREEVFADGTVGCPMIIYIKDGVKRDGTLVAREMKMVIDSGAYSGTTVIIAKNTGYGAAHTYRVPNFKLDSYAVATNNPAGGPYRGFAVRQVNWAMESQMDMIAERLGIDPVEMRRKNILREGEENACGETMHSIGAMECLDKVAEWIEWNKWNKRNKRNKESPPEGGPWKKGRGLALGGKYSRGGTSSVAIVKVHNDATIEIRHSAAEIGQGCNTVLAQIAAEEFDLPVDKVKVVYTDTAVTPYDWATVSNRVTFHVGNALRLACQDAKQQILAIASERIEIPAKDLEIRGQEIRAIGKPRVAMKITDLFMPEGYLAKGGELIGKATYTCPRSKEDPETGQGKRLVAYYSYGACAVEVAVNIETGKVKVLKLVQCADSQPINPKLCEAQLEGGMGMAIGSAISEEIIIDGGRIINPTFTNYGIPTFTQIPAVRNVKTMIAPMPHKEGPFGAKGIGELSIVPVAPAIANAVYNAVGIRIKDLPLTAEKCLKALEENNILRR